MIVYGFILKILLQKIFFNQFLCTFYKKIGSIHLPRLSFRRYFYSNNYITNQNRIYAYTFHQYDNNIILKII